MKVTVKIEDIEVTIDRPNFGDDGPDTTLAERRVNMMKDTVFPTLEAATARAK